MAGNKQSLNSIFAKYPSLKDMAKGKTYTRPLNPGYPGSTFDRPMGPSPRLYSPAIKGALWGGPEHITLSMLKTDIFDRRYFRTNPVTLKEVMEGAYSEANKAYDDMPRIGLTRPKYGTLLASGGRIDRQAWSELYPFFLHPDMGSTIGHGDHRVRLFCPP